MKKNRKFDYIEVCESRGELLEGRIGNTLLIIDSMGFNHEMDMASIRRGAKLGIRSVVDSQRSEYFVRTVVDKWGEGVSHFDFSNFEYKSVFEESVVICDYHGEFAVKPSNINKSKFVCKDCLGDHLAGVKTFSTEDFIEKCNRVHNNKYSYEKTEYKGNRNYVTVTCPEHGDFQVLARTHSSDSQACGCIKCTVKVGFSRSSYATVCPEGSYVYVMEISRGAERFIKIGLSKNPEERAVSIIRESGYEVSVLYKEFYLESNDAWDIESLLHREFKESNYLSYGRFRGETECFDVSIQDEVIKLLKTLA